jgi:aryl-alcohol dehydrogenase-like predicted oxidoreductase
MQRRRLGRSELMVPPLCVGGNVFGWTADEPTSFGVLDRFAAAGATFIDTADVYATWAPGNRGGESETIIGEWMKRRGNRGQIILATKVGSDMGGGRKGLARAYVKQAVEDSLRRLKTDYIDLYQTHRDDPNTTLEESLGTYAELIAAGKVRAIGFSNIGVERFREALALSAEKGLPRFESVQPEYNLCTRAPYEREYEPICRASEIGVISHTSLASGFLTGKYRAPADATKGPRGKGIAGKYFNPRATRILAALDDVAARHRATPAQVALAWLMARPGLTSAIASASRPEQTHDLIAAAALTLDAASIAALDAASADAP